MHWVVTSLAYLTDQQWRTNLRYLMLLMKREHSASCLDMLIITIQTAHCKFTKNSQCCACHHRNARSKLSRKRALRKVTIGGYYPTIFSALDCANKILILTLLLPSHISCAIIPIISP